MDYTKIQPESNRLLKSTPDEMRNWNLAELERNVFYPTGAVEGLLLDEINPNWRDNYFLHKFALEPYYPEPLGLLTRKQ